MTFLRVVYLLSPYTHSDFLGSLDPMTNRHFVLYVTKGNVLTNIINYKILLGTSVGYFLVTYSVHVEMVPHEMSEVFILLLKVRPIK